jgi:acyl-CoA synthetase (AMP-forming)/AMP-acid ligase II
MMDIPLNAWSLFGNVARHHPRTEVVTAGAGREVHRHTYADFAARTQQLMHARDELDLAPGARVATLAWNSYRHLEAYFAIPCTARVLHTANIRLSPDELAYVLRHARDEAILVDPEFLPVIEQIADRLPELRHIVPLDEPYEALLAKQPTEYARIDIPEQTPLGLCYTSGTTGKPKGVEYTHRSTFLHALAVTSAAAMCIGPSDSALAQVPMFHASAWGMPFASVAVGAKQVFFAGPLDAAAFVDTMVAEKVTVAAGVPTVWLAVADELSARGCSLPDVRHIVCGGSQPPRALIERYRDEFGIPIVQAWGMTETSPLASMAWPQQYMRGWEPEAVTAVASTQAGLPLPGIEVSIRDEDGAELPFDGESMGVLHVRGPWVVDSYLGGEGAGSFTEDGWFDTGDVAIGSPDGYFVIADRTKDLIKSGGEWISSVDMEAAIMAMAEVAEAAVVAVPDPKWQERPLACVVLRPGATVARDAVRAHLEANGFARWQLPDRVEVIDAVPKTAVGKFDKKVLRARFVTE